MAQTGFKEGISGVSMIETNETGKNLQLSPAEIARAMAELNKDKQSYKGAKAEVKATELLNSSSQEPSIQRLLANLRLFTVPELGLTNDNQIVVKLPQEGDKGQPGFLSGRHEKQLNPDYRVSAQTEQVIVQQLQDIAHGLLVTHPERYKANGQTDLRKLFVDAFTAYKFIVYEKIIPANSKLVTHIEDLTTQIMEIDNVMNSDFADEGHLFAAESYDVNPQGIRVANPNFLNLRHIEALTRELHPPRDLAETAKRFSARLLFFIQKGKSPKEYLQSRSNAKN